MVAYKFDRTYDTCKRTYKQYRGIYRIWFVFVYGSVDYRAKRVMSALDITQAKAKDKVLKTDKQRRTYYDYYTSKNWGVMSNYDLCIDAEKFGIEETANMIINAAKKKIK